MAAELPSSSSSLVAVSTAALAGAFIMAFGISSFRASGKKTGAKPGNDDGDLNSVTVTLPDWATSDSYYKQPYRSDEEMMALAIHLSARNVAEGTGGPFGTAIFERDTETNVARLLSVGVNRVVPLGNSTLHGETVAIQIAQRKVGTYTLHTTAGSDEGGQSPAQTRVRRELFTSCEPCAMCLGACLWSGVSRIVCGATKADAAAIGFDEGPVFEESYDHLRGAGIDVRRGLMREEAADVLKKYGENGLIYNR